MLVVYIIVMLAQLQSALHAQVAWLICIGLWLHLASVWQCPQLGNACAWQLSADYLDTSICIQVGPRLAMLQWPQPLSLTGSLPQPCIYGLSPSPGLKLEILRPSMGFESLELGLKALSQP